MKTKVLFFVLAIFIGAANVADAQKKDVKVYGFTYSVYKAYAYKDVYFSGVVGAVKNSTEYPNPVRNALGNQWNEKIKTLLDDYYKLDWIEYAWFENFDEVDTYRTKLIGEFKQKGFSIHYINDFYFKQK